MLATVWLQGGSQRRFGEGAGGWGGGGGRGFLPDQVQRGNTVAGTERRTDLLPQNRTKNSRPRRNRGQRAAAGRRPPGPAGPAGPDSRRDRHAAYIRPLAACAQDPWITVCSAVRAHLVWGGGGFPRDVGPRGQPKASLCWNRKHHRVVGRGKLDGGGGGLGPKRWPDQIFPMVTPLRGDFVVSHDDHCGRGGGVVQGGNPPSSDGVRPFLDFPGGRTLCSVAHDVCSLRTS